MALPLYASVADLSDWTGQQIPGADPRAGAVLSAASTLVRSFTGASWAEVEVPDDVRVVVVQVAARVWTNPAGLESFTIDDATRRWGASGGAGLRLMDSEKEILAAYQTGTPIDLGTVSLTTGAPGSDTVYVPTGPPPSGYPFPWYSADDLP